MNTLVRDARLLCTMDDRRTRIPGGQVYIEGDTDSQIGDLVRVRVLQGFTYDVVGERVEEA